MKVAFNKQLVESLPAGTHYDTKQSGLVLNVTATSRRWGVYKWSPRDQKPVRIAIGPYPAWSIEQARTKARELVHALDRGEPQEGDAAKVPKLGRITDDYELALKATGARFPAHFSDCIRLGCDDWRGRAADSITRAEVATRHNEISMSRGPTAAAKWVKALRAIYRHADLPCPAMKTRTAKAKPRARVATAAELAAVRAELAKLDPFWRDYFLLSILTGARRDNVASMRFEDVKGDTWTIPDTHAKMGEAITLPLLPEAQSIIESRRAALGTGYVFPSKGERGRLASTWERWDSVRRAAGCPDLTQHDLRRTMISRLAEAGVHPSVASRLAGHRSITTTLKHYTVVNEKMLREGLNSLAT